MTNSKKLNVSIGIAIFLFAVFAFFRWSPAGASLLWDMSRGGAYLLPLVVVSSLLDSINPCAFSVLLLTIAFLFGIGKLRSDILRIGGFYVLGIFAAYLLIGLGLLHALHFFNTPHFMSKVGAALALILGVIALVNYFFPAFPIKLGIPKVAHGKMAELMEKSSLPAVFILGMLVGLCEFPCTGGPYIMILGLLHDKATYSNGIGYLIIYNLIFVLPLIAILSIAADNLVVEKIQAWKKKENSTIRLWGGIAMILLGLIVFLL